MEDLPVLGPLPSDLAFFSDGASLAILFIIVHGLEGAETTKNTFIYVYGKEKTEATKRQTIVL